MNNFNKLCNLIVEGSKWNLLEAENKIDSFKFGKYNLLRPGRIGYVFSYDSHKDNLSTITKRNLQNLIKLYGFSFDKIIISPVFDSRDQELRQEYNTIINMLKSRKISLPRHLKTFEAFLKDPRNFGLPNSKKDISKPFTSRKTILITGIDFNKEPIVYARIETANPAAGQTKIYWKNTWTFVSSMSNPPSPIKFRLGQQQGDVDTMIDASLDMF